MHLPKVSLADPMSLIRLGGQTIVADRHPGVGGRLPVPGRGARPRPPLGHPATARLTVVFALPLGYFLTRQHVGRRRCRRRRDHHRTRAVRVFRRPGRRKGERVQQPSGRSRSPLVAGLGPDARGRQRGGLSMKAAVYGRSPGSSTGSHRPWPNQRLPTSTRAWARCSPTGSATPSRSPVCSGSSSSRSRSGRAAGALRCHGRGGKPGCRDPDRDRSCWTSASAGRHGTSWSPWPAWASRRRGGRHLARPRRHRGRGTRRRRTGTRPSRGRSGDDRTPVSRLTTRNPPRRRRAARPGGRSQERREPVPARPPELRQRPARTPAWRPCPALVPCVRGGATDHPGTQQRTPAPRHHPALPPSRLMARRRSGASPPKGFASSSRWMNRMQPPAVAGRM